jgi:hypothetical protein
MLSMLCNSKIEANNNVPGKQSNEHNRLDSSIKLKPDKLISNLFSEFPAVKQNDSTNQP